MDKRLQKMEKKIQKARDKELLEANFNKWAVKALEGQGAAAHKWSKKPSEKACSDSTRAASTQGGKLLLC